MHALDQEDRRILNEIAKEGNEEGNTVHEWNENNQKSRKKRRTVASQPRVRQWTNDATRAAWLAKRNVGLLAIGQASTELVWQEASLGKPLCEDMRVQLARASRERSYSARQTLYHQKAMIEFKWRTSVTLHRQHISKPQTHDISLAEDYLYCNKKKIKNNYNISILCAYALYSRQVYRQ